MNLILADTSGLYSLFSTRDRYHSLSRDFYQTLLPRTQIIVIEYILLETMTLLRSRGFSSQAVQFRQTLESSGVLVLHYSSVKSEAETFDVFRRFADKKWSYADCALLATANILDITNVFSFDHHIDQMGLRRVPSLRMG